MMTIPLKMRREKVRDIPNLDWICMSDITYDHPKIGKDSVTAPIYRDNLTGHLVLIVTLPDGKEIYAHGRSESEMNDDFKDKLLNALN